MKHVCAVVLFGLLAGSAIGATFSAGGGQGSSTVGSVGDDYPNLAAAAADFSSFAGGSTGNWTLRITSATLTEPNNIAFANNTNGFSVTVKPDTGVTSVITFTTATANPGATSAAWSGNWIIGSPAIGSPLDNLTTTSNFTIDGSNNGTTSRNLTITNNAVSSETSLIRVVGGCNNTTIKNAILVSNVSGSQLNFPIEFTARRTVAGLDHIPNGCHVDNCDVTVLNGSNSQNILFRQASSGSITTGTAIDNVTITSNTINGIQNAINLGLVSNAVVTDNILSMTAVLNSRSPIGIQHNLSNQVTGWSQTIARNQYITWDNASTLAANSSQGIGPMVELDPGVGSGTYNVYNNFFGGVKYTGPTSVTSNGQYRGVTLKCSVANVASIAHVYHNSFNLPNLSKFTQANRADLYHAVGITTSTAAATFTGSVDVIDNIFLQEQNNGVVFYKTSAGAGTFTSNNNTVQLGSAGAKMASYNTPTTANYATLAAWQGAGFDSATVSANPTIAAGGFGKWVSNTDLHFDAYPGPNYLGVAVGITTDIDGQSRSGTNPIKGADETAITALVSDWTLFE